MYNNTGYRLIRRTLHVRESSFQNLGNFCCGIQIAELWNREYGSRNPAQARNPLTIGILNPSSTDKESGIRNPWGRIQNPESRIQNPESRIQNLPFCRERLVIWDRVFSLFRFRSRVHSHFFLVREVIQIAVQEWLVLSVQANSLPLPAKLHLTQALWVYLRENSCHMMNQGPKDMMNSLIRHLKVNTNAQSVFLAWENRCRRAVATDSVEVAFCVR